MFPDLITPRAFPELLQRPDYDPMAVIPWPLPARPRVFTTGARLARAAQRLAENQPIDKACMSVMLDACGLANPAPTEVGAQATPDAIAGASLRNAIAFHITGDARHFDRALHLLRILALSKAWEKWTGFEGHLIARLAGAYDLLAARTLPAADDTLIHDMLLAMPAVLDRPGHRRCNNHNVFNIMARLAVGLALDHRPTIHDAVYGLERAGNWRYGLIHQLRHDILADGMQWEGSMSYHMLVMSGLCECVTMFENIGVDLWHRSLPNAMQDEGHDEHRGWGPKGEKCIRAGVDAFIYQALPNGDYSIIHDQILANIRGAGVWWPIFAKAFEVYGDQRYAAILHRMDRDHPADASDVRPYWLRAASGDLEWIRLENRAVPPGRFSFADDAKISLTGRHENGCSLFPSHGSAVLRSEPENTNGLGAYFYFGPHWAGHRSPGSLHLDVVFNNRRITHAPHLYKGGYDEPKHLTWHRATIAHNTVAVDERSMFPFDFETESLWETDYWRSRISDSELRFFQPGNDFKAVRVSNDNVYEGSLLDRTIVTTPTMLIDVFRVSSGAEHQFDWALHVHGSIAKPAGATPVSLGDQRGYRHMTDAWQHPQLRGLLSTHINYDGAETIAHVFLPTAGAPSLIVAMDPEPDMLTPIGDMRKPEPRTALIVRNKTRACVFISVWQFTPGGAPPALISSDALGDVVLETHEGAAARRWLFHGQGGVECV